MPYLSRLAAASASLLLLAACGPGDPTVGRSQHAIVGGSQASGMDAIGIVVAGSTSGCSGTLISDSVVLTAGHCVAERPDAKFYIGSLDGPQYRVEQVLVHPDYAGGNRADIALLKLAQPVPGVDPIDIARTPLTEGEPIMLVGFGEIGESGGGFGVRRKSENTVGKVRAETFTVYGNANVCDGDSGGPSLATRGGEQVVVGVHSTKSGGCGVEGNDMRVDVFSGWIDAHIGQSDTSDVTPPSLLMITPTVGALTRDAITAAVAARDDGCGVKRVLFRVDGSVVASATKPPYEVGIVGLGPGPHTLRISAEDGAGNLASIDVRFETSDTSAPVTFGGACTADAQCGSQVCAAGGLDGRFCTQRCQVGGIAVCPSGYECRDSICKLGPDMRGYGARCDSADACASGLCTAGLDGANVCTRTCDPQHPCAGGGRCEQRGGRNVCVIAALDGGSGGCSLGSGSRDTGALALPLVLLLLGLALSRRVRRPRA